MLGTLFKLVPALHWPTFLGAGHHQGKNHEQIAITSCLSAVKGYFPCTTNTSTTSDYTCLCEQYLWRISCFDNHASNPLSHPDRAATEIATTDFCRKAGSVGVERVKREHQRQKRQIGDFLSSIVGDVSSVLSSNDVTVPTAVIESVAGSVVNALPTPANPTSIAAQITAASESSSTAPSASEEESSTATSAQAESTGITQAGSTAASASSQQPTSSLSAEDTIIPSDKFSGPSAGLIAGVVVGAVAALALLGIFILLLLRYRKKKSQKPPFADKESSPTNSSREDQHPPANAAYQNVPQQNAYPTTTTIPTSTDAPSSRPATILSPVSPITPGGQAPWASSTFVGGAGAAGAGAGAGAGGAVADAADQSPTSHLPRYSEDNRYSDEKPPQRHQFMDSKIPEGNEMPTNANVWEIGGREIPHPSELDAGRRDGSNPGDTRQQQGQGYAAYRPPSIQDGQQDGEFLGNRPVGQAL